MPLTNTQYASVMRVYDDIRSHNQALQTERYNEVVNKCPEYSLIENEIITLSMKEASRRIVSDSSDTDLDEYNLKLKKLIARKAELLASIGKPKDYLDDIYTCPVCHDTGYVNGSRCSCFKKKAIDLIYEDSNLKNITSSENLNGTIRNRSILSQGSHLTIICTKFLMYASLLYRPLIIVSLTCY